MTPAGSLLLNLGVLNFLSYSHFLRLLQLLPHNGKVITKKIIPSWIVPSSGKRDCYAVILRILSKTLLSFIDSTLTYCITEVRTLWGEGLSLKAVWLSS